MRKVSEENGITEVGKKINDFLTENNLEAIVVFPEKYTETGDDEIIYSVLCSIQNLGKDYLEGFIVGLEKAQSILIANIYDDDMLQQLFSKHVEECTEEKKNDEPKIILFDPDRRRD